MYQQTLQGIVPSPQPTFETLDEAIPSIDLEYIRREYKTLSGDAPVRQIYPQSRSRFDRYKDQISRGVQAVSTPYKAVNESCRGLAGGEGLQTGSVYYLAAGPGIGKSLNLTPFLFHATMNAVPAALLNLEMSGIETSMRMLAQFSGVPVRAFEPGRSFREDVWDKTVSEFLAAQHAPLFMNEEARIYTPQDVVQIIMVLARKFGVKLFAIDYVQRMRVPGLVDDRQQVEMMSAELCDLAQSLDITILAVSQLTRAAIERGTTPGITDLQWSSRLEQDARGVFILDHTRVERLEDHSRTIKRFALCVSKQRAGYGGTVILDQDMMSLEITQAPRQDMEWDSHDERWVTKAHSGMGQAFGFTSSEAPNAVRKYSPEAPTVA